MRSEIRSRFSAGGLPLALGLLLVACLLLGQLDDAQAKTLLKRSPAAADRRLNKHLMTTPPRQTTAEPAEAAADEEDLGESRTSDPDMPTDDQNHAKPTSAPEGSRADPAVDAPAETIGAPDGTTAAPADSSEDGGSRTDGAELEGSRTDVGEADSPAAEEHAATTAAPAEPTEHAGSRGAQLKPAKTDGSTASPNAEEPEESEDSRDGLAEEAESDAGSRADESAASEPKPARAAPATTPEPEGEERSGAGEAEDEDKGEDAAGSEGDVKPSSKPKGVEPDKGKSRGNPCWCDGCCGKSQPSAKPHPRPDWRFSSSTTPNPTKPPTTQPPPTTRKPDRIVVVSTRAPAKVSVIVPTKLPPRRPTKVPTKLPTKVPTKVPTMAPTKVPTMAPTMAPAPTKPACDSKPDCVCNYKEMKESDKLLAVVITNKGGFKGRRLNKGTMMALLKATKTTTNASGELVVSTNNTFVFPAGNYYFPHPIRFAGFASP